MTARKLRISPTLSLPRDTPTQTIVVYGGKGMGKSNLGAVICEELSATGFRFSVVDPMGVFWGLRHAKDGQGPGIEVLILGGKHGDIPIEPTGGAVVADLVADEDADVVIDISRRPDGTMWSLGERIRFVTDYCTRLYQRQGERARPIMQLIDEAGRFVPQIIPHGSPQLAQCVGAIERMVEEGRNVGIGVTLITQRSARMNKSVSELAECMIAFRTVGPRSVDAILDWFGEHVGKSRWKELVEQLRALPRGTALVVSPGWLEFEGVVAMRERETFDSSATPEAGKERRASGPGAKPDLARYQARMVETIERAKAEDPKALQRRVKELEAQLAKAARTPAAAKAVEKRVPDERAVFRALDRQAAAISKRNAEAVRKARTIPKQITGIQAELSSMWDRVQWVVAALETPVPVDPDSNGKGILPPASAPAAAPRVPAARVERQVTRPTVEDADGALPPGERAILVAAAQNEDGATREQLTILTGYMKSTRNAYIARLQARGYVDASGDTVTATDAGIAVLGDDYEPLPTGSELRDYWLNRLPPGESKILGALIDVYPEPLDRETISAAAEFSKSTRNAYLARLATRKLIAAVGKGEVRASATLFD